MPSHPPEAGTGGTPSRGTARAASRSRPGSALEAWLSVNRALGSGAHLAARLLQRLGSAEAILAAAPAELSRHGAPPAVVRALREPDRAGVGRDLDWLRGGADRCAVTLDDPAYPPRLRGIADPPAVLFVRGDPQVLRLPQLAMVGSRSPTPLGRETAAAFAQDLSREGLTIISGLAAGIDSAAHEGALEGTAPSVAVLGCGPDLVYPASNTRLAESIAEQGAVISEFPVGVRPAGRNFPRRNRIISGLALGVLVVEAAVRSGSLITARLAVEQGREVFAVPGSIHNPMARGCHSLIRQGAKLVETSGDVLEELAALIDVSRDLAPGPAPRGDCPRATRRSGERPSDPRARETLDEDYRQLIEAMGHDPVGIDQLVDRIGLTPEALSSMLLLLELQGFVTSVPGGLYSRTTKSL